MSDKVPFDDGAIPPSEPLMGVLVILIFITLGIGLVFLCFLMLTAIIHLIGADILGVWK